MDALLNDDYDPTVKDPSKLKQYLNIDRDHLKELHCMGIYPTLDFFVQYDEEKQEYQRINSEINVENFEKIHNNKYKVEIENSNIMQHIQE